MIIDKYFLSLRNLLCHYVGFFFKSLMYCACSFLHSGVCQANLGGSCLDSGGSWRPGGSLPRKTRKIKTWIWNLRMIRGREGKTKKIKAWIWNLRMMRGGDKESKNLNLKSENDCPDETQNHPGVSVHNILSTNIFQTNLNQRNSWRDRSQQVMSFFKLSFIARSKFGTV